MMESRSQKQAEAVSASKSSRPELGKGEPQAGERTPRHFDALRAPELDEAVKNSYSSQHAVVQGIGNVEF